MPSPLNTQLLKLKQAFHAQWNDEAKVHIAEIIHSKQFSILAALFVSSLIVQIVSGLLLSIHFSPSSATVINERGDFLAVKNIEKVLLDAEGDTLATPGDKVFLAAGAEDVIPTRSYQSIVHISQTTPLKHIRTIHAINTHCLLAIIISILVFFGIHVKDTRYFRGLWLMMILVSLLITMIAWMGYILPWDQFSSTSYLIVQGIHEQGLGIVLGQPMDIIARYFSLHSMVFPILTIALLFPIGRMFHFSFRNINQSFAYAFILLIMISGIVFERLNPILPPAHALIPSSTSLEPSWFFQPIHGIISTMPADLACIIISIIVVAINLLPFIESYRMRISALGIMIVLSIVYAIIY
jgi:quinol-cytochrome oxidoreductase complex cytochrome b subunit